MALLEVEAVSKNFGSLAAVDGVSFAVEAGAIFGIAGPNGSGKSTLFNIITGIPFGPDRGRIVFDRGNIHGRPGFEIARLGIARTFQRETAFDSLSVYENVLMGATYGKTETTDRKAAAATLAALELVGLDAAQFGRPARELSVYDRKCLMLASALATEPRLLLLDEPASGLTMPEIDLTIAIIRRIAAGGVTILLIEHVLMFLMSVSQHLIVMNQGRVLVAGEPRQALDDERVIEAYLGTRRHAI